MFEVVLRDRSGTARAVWFNQRFLKDVLRAGQTVALFGKVEQGAGGLQFASPQYEILADEPLAGGWLGAADADADSIPRPRRRAARRRRRSRSTSASCRSTSASAR